MTKLGKTLTVGLLLVPVMGWSSVCLADEGPDLDDTVTNSAETTPTLDGSEIQVLDQSEFEERLRAFEGRQYPAIAYLGGEMLGVDPEFVHDCREGLEMIYQRDYSGAMSHWDDLGRKWRGTGVAPVGRVLVWQALRLFLRLLCRI